MREGITHLEPLMSKKEIAAFFTVGVRTIERCMANEMPQHRIFGKAAFRVSEVEPWLEEHGYLEKRGEAA